MPAQPHDYLEVHVEMGFGSREEHTMQVMEQIRLALFDVNQEYIQESGDSEGFVRHVIRTLRSESTGVFFVELTKDEHRSINSFEIIERWQSAVGEVPAAERLSFSAFRSGGSRQLSYVFASNKPEVLEDAAQDFIDGLKEIQGLYDLQSSREGSRPEYVLTLKPKATALDLTLADVSLQVRAAFYGIEIERFQRGNEEVKVMLSYPENRRADLIDLENMHIKTRDGRLFH